MLNLVLKLTDACNLRCTYCYQKDNGYQSGMMTFDIADRAMQSYLEDILKGDTSIGSVTFMGGEPLLNFPIIEQILIKYPDFRYFITTNGTLLTKERLDILKRYKVYISISIDGGDEESQNINRTYINGSGTFDEVFRALKELDGYEYWNVNMVASKNNVRYMLDNILFFVFKIKAPLTKINFDSNGYTDMAFIKEYFSQAAVFFNYLKKNFSELERDNILEKLFFDSFGESCRENIGKTFSIHNSGDLYLCNTVSELANKKFVIGNIMEDPHILLKYEQLRYGVVSETNIDKMLDNPFPLCSVLDKDLNPKKKIISGYTVCLMLYKRFENLMRPQSRFK